MGSAIDLVDDGGSIATQNSQGTNKTTKSTAQKLIVKTAEIKKKEEDLRNERIKTSMLETQAEEERARNLALQNAAEDANLHLSEQNKALEEERNRSVALATQLKLLQESLKPLSLDPGEQDSCKSFTVTPTKGSGTLGFVPPEHRKPPDKATTSAELSSGGGNN